MYFIYTINNDDSVSPQTHRSIQWESPLENAKFSWRQKAAAFGCRTVCIGLIQPQGETDLQLILGARARAL